MLRPVTPAPITTTDCGLDDGMELFYGCACGGTRGREVNRGARREHRGRGAGVRVDAVRRSRDAFETEKRRFEAIVRQLMCS